MLMAPGAVPGGECFTRFTRKWILEADLFMAGKNRH